MSITTVFTHAHMKTHMCTHRLGCEGKTVEQIGASCADRGAGVCVMGKGQGTTVISRYQC